MPSPKLVRKITLVWLNHIIQTQPDHSPYLLDSHPKVSGICQVKCAFRKPQVTLKELAFLRGQFLLLRLLRKFPKDGWVQFLVHHTGGLQHLAHISLFRTAMTSCLTTCLHLSCSSAPELCAVLPSPFLISPVSVPAPGWFPFLHLPLMMAAGRGEESPVFGLQ